MSGKRHAGGWRTSTKSMKSAGGKLLFVLFFYCNICEFLYSRCRCTEYSILYKTEPESFEIFVFYVYSSRLTVLSSAPTWRLCCFHATTCPNSTSFSSTKAFCDDVRHLPAANALFLLIFVSSTVVGSFLSALQPACALYKVGAARGCAWERRRGAFPRWATWHISSHRR